MQNKVTQCKLRCNAGVAMQDNNGGTVQYWQQTQF